MLITNHSHMSQHRFSNCYEFDHDDPIYLRSVSLGNSILISIGWIAAPSAMVTWTMPPIIGSLMATGWDWRAAVWSAVELLLAGAMYFHSLKLLKSRCLLKKPMTQMNNFRY